MPIGEFRISAEPPTSGGVTDLMRERDDYFDRLYANEDRNARSVDLHEEGLVLLTIRNDHELIGCGALLMRSTFGELKRFYLREGFRGRGLGRRLVQALETEARSRGCRKLMLETGVLQPDAIALYEGQGFRRRGPFGTYEDDPLSIFMEKIVTPA